MKPTALLRNKFSVLATTPRPWLISFSLAGDLGLSRHIESLLRFCEGMIDYGLNRPRRVPTRKLAARAGVWPVKDGTLVRREDRVAW